MFPVLCAQLPREKSMKENFLGLGKWLVVGGVLLGIGGLLVPLVRGVTVADLALRLDLPVLIVSRTELGTVNHTLLTVEAARSRGIEIVGIVFNRLRPGRLRQDERTGPSEAVHESGATDLGTFPFHAHLSPPDFPRLGRCCAKHVKVDTILSAMRHA